MKSLPKRLLLLIVLGTGPAVAQEPPPATPDATTTEVAEVLEVVTPAEKPENEDQAKAEKAPAALDTYRPSENISQDLGVSFPVDI